MPSNMRALDRAACDRDLRNANSNFAWAASDKVDKAIRALKALRERCRTPGEAHA